MPIAVNRAEKVRKELFSRYDELNALWRDAEAELTKLHIPRDVMYVYHSYDVGHPQDSGCYFCYCLGLQKIKGNWRLCHGTYYDQCEPFEPEDWTPIIDCSAEFRVKAASHLDGLRRELIQSSEKFILEVDKAIVLLKKDVAKCAITANQSSANIKA